MARGYAVRFCFVYFGLWCAATQVLGGLLLTPFGGVPALGPLWPMRLVTEWVGTHLFGVDARFAAGNSGDTLFYWVQTFWIVCLSAIAAAIWSWVDRVDRPTLHGWFRVFIRFALAAQMFYFGMAKIFGGSSLPWCERTNVRMRRRSPSAFTCSQRLRCCRFHGGAYRTVRRAIFDYPDRMTFQRTDDSLARYGVSVDTNGRMMRLSKGNSDFRWVRPPD